MTRTAAIFDMDHTLVNANTGTLYMKWRYRRGEIRKRDLVRFARWMAQYSLGAIDAQEIQANAARSLEGTDVAEFEADLGEWYRQYVRPAITDAARREVERRRARGDLLLVLSASTPFAVRPLADDLGIEHAVCTELEVRGGKFTGRFARLCYGVEKVHAARAWAAEHGVDLARSAFYTDSVSDLPLLWHVGEPRVINPDLSLRIRARLHGWRIETWT